MKGFETFRERLKKVADRQSGWPEAVPGETAPNFTFKLSTPPVWTRNVGFLSGHCTLQLSPGLLLDGTKHQKEPTLASGGVGIVFQSDTPALVLQCVDFSMQGFRWKCHIGLSKEEFFSVEQHLSGIDRTNGGPMRSMLSVVIKGYDCERAFPNSVIDFSFRVINYKVLVGGMLIASEFAPSRNGGE